MYQGVVVFKLSNVKSKSESVKPYLYLGNSKFIRIYFEGDNPFQNSKLKPFDGLTVCVEGTMDENDILIANSVKKLKTDSADPKDNKDDLKGERR